MISKIGFVIGLVVAYFGSRSYDSCVLNPDPSCSAVSSMLGKLFAIPLSVVQPIVRTIINDQSKFITEVFVSHIISGLIIAIVFGLVGALIVRMIRR